MKVYLFRKEEMKVNLKNKVVEIENISKLLDIELINDVKIKLDEGMGVYFFEKYLSFLSPVSFVVFEILKILAQNLQKMRKK